MHILLISNYQPDHQESMLRFSSLLSDMMHKNHIRHITWRPRPVLTRLFKLGPLNKLSGYIDKFLLGSLEIMYLGLTNKITTYHILDHGNSLYAFFTPRRKTLITCHDCIAIEEAFHGRTGERVGKFGKIFQQLICIGLRRAAHVAAVSHETARDLQRLTGVPQDRITVIHNTIYSDVKRLPKPSCISHLAPLGFPQEKGFIFMLGSNLLRKNRAGAIRAYERFRSKYRTDIQLVIAGKPISGPAKELMISSPYSDSMHYIGSVDDKTLSALYSSCDVFLFPSLAEGFGVPIIEAQSCGTVVVTSNNQPMPEVGGNGAIYADPLNPEALADAMQQALQERDTLVHLAKENSQKFSPQKMSDGYIRKYREIER